MIVRAGPGDHSDTSGLHASIDTCFDPHLLLDPVHDEHGRLVDLIVRDLNPAACARIGRPRAASIGLSLSELVGTDVTALLDEFVARIPTGRPLVLPDFATPASSDPAGRSSRAVEVRAVRVGDSFSVCWHGATDPTASWTGSATLVPPTADPSPRRDPAADVPDGLFHLAMERSAVGMCLVGPDGTFRAVNAALCEMLGRPREELVTCTWQELTHPDDLESDLTLVADVLEGRRDHYRLLKRYVRPDGSVIWGDLSVGAVREPTGEVRMFVSQIVDVTELTAARQALMESELHYRLLAENASDVILRLDPQDAVTWASPSAAEVFGWEPDDLVGTRMDDFVHPDDIERVRAAREAHARGRSAVDEVRTRRADGSYVWVSARSCPIRDDAGAVDGSVVTLRDVNDRVLAHRARAELDARYRLLAENTTDIVVETTAEGTIRWVSPSVEAALGWRPEQLVGTGTLDMIADADRAETEQRHLALFAGAAIPDFEVRVRSADGDVRWMRLHAEPIRDDTGATTAAVVGLLDCQAEVVGRRALKTQSVGHSILARCTGEEELFADMCQAAVDEAGYLLAWYGRRRRDERRTVEVVATSREHADYLDEIEITWDDGPLGQGPTGRSLRAAATSILQDFGASAEFTPWLEAAKERGFRSSIALPVFVNGQLDGAFTVYAPERHAFDEDAVAVLEDLATQLGYGIAKLRDSQALAGSLRRSRLLASAIEQAAEAIVITDPSPSIIYANPAAARSSGYSLDEMLGHNPRIFQSGLHPPEHYEAMWSALIGGDAWHGALVNRRKDGTLYEEASAVAPVYDVDGSLVAYVAVKRDTTRERDLEAVLTQTRSDQEALAEVMGHLHTGAGLEATTAEFCTAACRLDGIDAAAVLLLQTDGTVRTVAVAGSQPAPFVVGGIVPMDANSNWRDHLGRGAVWSIDLYDPVDPRPGSLGDAVRAAGVTAAVVAPVHWDEALTGMVAVFSFDPDGAARLAAHETLVGQLAYFAGSLFGHELASRSEREAVHARIRACIDERRFHCVFQPVVDIATSAVRGYEALTRFDDSPDTEGTFAQAHAVGLGTELETTCLRVALAEAPRLPPTAWVSVNLSPTAILNGRAASFLVAADRQVVVEITEHTVIQDYAQIRRALEAIPGVWLSVDDAGAGYASLRHILELRPEIVKMDVALVRNIDTDPARQGLAAGLSHFANQTGTLLIAEGVETPEEAAMLQTLGVFHAQGFLYGRPTRVP
ncbi:MAG: PAS domain S-box protein [Acidimicrobiia bacterium]|jgi:PAS domain S-box-containing protein